MKLLNQAFFLLLILACFITSKAQNPSYFKLGEEELSGINIYDILQDKNRNYWLATDNGLIKYDGYKFKNIECKDALSNSVFDLQLDYNDNIFCLNLSGQIFRIKNDSCQLHFQIPDSLIASEVYYAFDNLNRLTIASNSIFTVNRNKKISFVVPKNMIGNRFYQFLVLKDSSLITHNVGHREFITLKNDSHLITTINTSNFIIQGVYLNNQLLYFDKATGNFLNRKNTFFEINKDFLTSEKKPELLRYYSDNHNLWIASLAGGIKILDKNLKPLFNNNTFFQNNIIASFCKDNEGNTILGTFGEGLIIIPNLNVIDIKLPDVDVKVTRITSTPENTIFLGTQDGRIFEKRKEEPIKVFKEGLTKNIEVLYYIDKSNELLIEDKNPLIINLSSGKETKYYIGAIKDVKKITDNLYLIASNVGLSYFIPKNNKIHMKKNTRLKNFKERTNCVNFDPKTQSIYAGTSQGLKIGNENKASYFKLKGSSLICRDILYFDGAIFVATQKNGILVFKNDKLFDHWTLKKELISVGVKHIKSHRGKLFISTNKGLQILNKKGETLFVLNKATGLYANKVIAFEIQNDALWVVHHKGVQKVNINTLKPFVYQPVISLDKIVVNDVIISFLESTNFTYVQNKFEFYISSNSIKYKNEINYHHQLIGIDKEWQIDNYENNKIEYKSLAHGKYTFKIKAQCRNKESKILTYSFVITPPFWNTWWFYSIIGFLIITTTFFLYKHQLKKQKKKIQLKHELNASKLIAIQSQMNPHFIFNAINSIQDLILKGDIDNSYSYIIKFSKLVRQTLNFSDKEFIDIEDEIELLKIYLELEKLRFKNDFEYTINCNIDDLQVPPMLVQPFVENAIKHGLLHKEGIKKLDITFEKNEILSCTVIDNGIGRKKAQEIKDRQQKSHQSFSVDATKGRFEIMKSHYQEDLGVAYKDLIKNGTPTGTKVIINMPWKQHY